VKPEPFAEVFPLLSAFLCKCIWAEKFAADARNDVCFLRVN